MAVTTERLTIDGPAGTLEAMLEVPDPALHGGVSDGPSDFAAVICHPHPQFQGTMLNKVVHTLSRSCTDAGIPALRFNYRGVGASKGQYDDGHGEALDAAAAIRYLRQRAPQAAIVLAGFSFGAGVAIRHAVLEPPAALITVAPPVGRAGMPERTGIEIPWLLVQGGADELVDSGAVQQWAKQQLPSPHFHMMAGVSHFFHGNLTRLREIAAGFLQQRLAVSAVPQKP